MLTLIKIIICSPYDYFMLHDVFVGLLLFFPCSFFACFFVDTHIKEIFAKTRLIIHQLHQSHAH